MSEKVTEITGNNEVLTISGGTEVVTVVNDLSIQIVSISSEGPQGRPGSGLPAGGEARQLLRKVDNADGNADWVYTFDQMILNFKATSATPTVIATGEVYEGTFTGLGTIYQFVSSAFTGLYPTEQSFYRNFDGTNLTNLIVSRG